MSPKRQHSRSETGTQVPMSQGYPTQSMYSQSPQVQQGGQSQSQYSTSAAHPNLAAVHNWSMQDAHQQNFAPTRTPPVPLPGFPQTQISQNPMQSNEQLGQMQTNQAYNHMWQYYYYQQQQQQQQQQPLPQQQLLQQQYQQHPQLLQVQQQYLQQQQLPYQQPQLLQQQQFIQQQQYLQQQQQQLQPQGSYQQQFPPPNPHPYRQQQQEQEKRQQEGQITASQVQTQSELSKEESMMEPRRQTTLQVQDPLPCRNDASETVLSTISPNSQQG